MGSTHGRPNATFARNAGRLVSMFGVTESVRSVGLIEKRWREL